MSIFDAYLKRVYNEMAVSADSIEDDDFLLNDIRKISNELEKIIDKALLQKLYKKERHRGEVFFAIDTSSIFNKIDEDILRGLDEQLDELQLRELIQDNLQKKYFKVGWEKIDLSTDFKKVALKKK